MKALKYILFFFINNFINIFVFITNIFIWRTKKIWIIGSWFGDSFNDNSRFLYQHIFENKEKFGIKRIIWMTRNKEILNKLSQNKYDVLYINSLKGIYYHLRSKVHILCNNASFFEYKHDLNTYLSFGAKKVQLWHGVGIKACGRLKNGSKNTFISNFYYNFISRYGQPGMWGRCYQIATSNENKRVVIEDFAIIPSRVIIGSYPRNNDCPKLIDDEVDMVNNIRKLKTNKKIIMYLPTFRNKMDNYISPHSISGFSKFLEDNNFIWLEKAHKADKSLKTNITDSINTISLPSNFDVNILYGYIDMLITDYSSASTDAIARDVMTLEYCPDYDYYIKNDRGFVNDFNKYHIGNLVTEPKELFATIKECIYKNPLDNENHILTKKFLLGDRILNLDEIVFRIKEALRI